MIIKSQNTSIPYIKSNIKNTKQQSFKGAGTAGVGVLNFLNDSPAIGACLVDLISMVIPRTLFDYFKRNNDLGIETGSRESMSMANHASVGLVGLGAATALSGGILRDYGVKANKIFANGETIDAFKDFWSNATDDNKLHSFYQNVLDNAEGLNNSQWKKLTFKKPVVELLTSENVLKNGLDKAEKNILKNKIVSQIGADVKYRLKTSKGKYIECSLDTLLDTMESLGGAFKKVGVDKLDHFVGDLKKTKLKSALLGLAISSAIGYSIQPINKFITKKRTGKEGFIGVENREPDKSKGFKLQKAAAAGAMGLFAFKSIGKNIPDVLSKIQFTSKLPSISQFKLLYGITIMSRFLSSRDKNELREGAIKDSLGFATWLILGDVVTKVAAHGLDHSLINNPIVQKTGSKIKDGFNWLTKVSVKSYKEVLLDGATDTVKDAVRNGRELSFAKMLKLSDKAQKLKIGKLATAQLAGYVYSGVVLGLGIAKLNAFITSKVDKKEHKTDESAVKK